MTAIATHGIARVEAWPLHVPFVISRSSRTEVHVVYVEISDGTYMGRGECQPNSRYGEVPEDVAVELNRFFTQHPTFDASTVTALGSASARNALDCALWDLQAKQQGRRIWDIIGTPEPAAVPTVFTLSLGVPDAMAAAAQKAWSEGKRLLKLKLGGQGDDARVRSVRQAVPDAVLVADANEAWDEDLLVRYLPVMEGAGLALLEQPLPAGHDAALRDMPRSIPICADESCHRASDIPGLVGKYDMVNIKLDKTGGLSAALELEAAARDAGLDIMVGCMLGTSLAMAPAMLIAARARFADLDGPLLLSKDRDHKIDFTTAYELTPFSEKLWG